MGPVVAHDTTRSAAPPFTEAAVFSDGSMCLPLQSVTGSVHVTRRAESRFSGWKRYYSITDLALELHEFRWISIISTMAETGCTELSSSDAPGPGKSSKTSVGGGRGDKRLPAVPLTRPRDPVGSPTLDAGHQLPPHPDLLRPGRTPPSPPEGPAARPRVMRGLSLGQTITRPSRPGERSPAPAHRSGSHAAHQRTLRRPWPGPGGRPVLVGAPARSVREGLRAIPPLQELGEDPPPQPGVEGLARWVTDSCRRSIAHSQCRPRIRSGSYGSCWPPCPRSRQRGMSPPSASTTAHYRHTRRRRIRGMQRWRTGSFPTRPAASPGRNPRPRQRPWPAPSSGQEGRHTPVPLHSSRKRGSSPK